MSILTELEVVVARNPGSTVAMGTETAGVGTISNGGAGSGTITGTGTRFLSQCIAGETIVAGSETRTVRSVVSDTSMITEPFTGALSGATFQVNTAAQRRWQLLDNGIVLGGNSGLDPALPTALLDYRPTTAMDNGSNSVVSTVGRFSNAVEYSGAGNSHSYGVQAGVVISRTTTAPGATDGVGVEGNFTVGATNTKDWPAGLPAFSSAALRGNVFAHSLASGTIGQSSGVSSVVDASNAASLNYTKMFGYSLVKVAAANLVNGVGAGLYNVGGTNRAYIVLSQTSMAVPSGNWAIYDDTGYDTRLKGAVKIGASSTTVIDSNAILYQYGVALPKNNNNASVAPTATDDSAAGYSVGSVWFQPSTGRNWRLRDATAGAAKWVEMAIAEQPAYISGNWYMAPDMTVAPGTPPAADAIQFVPLLLKSRVTLASLGVRITTAEHGGSLQLALYANNPATGRPTGAAVATTASISTASTGTVSAAIAGGNVTLEPGLYWAGFNLDSTAGGLVAVQVPSPDNHPTAALIGSATQANLGASGSDDLVSLFVAQAFGTWPNLTSGTFTEGSTPSRNGPAIHFKIA